MTVISEFSTINNGATLQPSARPASTDRVVAKVKDLLGEAWLPRIYRQRILTMRTRAHNIHPATRGMSVEIQHTLLGIELKVGRHRTLCPDLATARYLAVFACAGCADVAVPYDITQISLLADDLESTWQRMLLLVDHIADNRSAAFRSRIRAALVSNVRQEVEADGAGPAVPYFNQNTKQRPSRRA